MSSIYILGVCMSSIISRGFVCLQYISQEKKVFVFSSIKLNTIQGGGYTQNQRNCNTYL